MPRPGPTVRCRLAGQRVKRTTCPRGLGLDVGVQPNLADPQLGDRRRKVDVVDQHVHPGSPQAEHLTDLGGDGGQRWSPLANYMGYTRTPEQRETILAAIRRMTWIAIRPPYALLSMHVGPAARTVAAAITHGSPLRSAAIASLQPGHTLIGLAEVTGACHYLIDLRLEAIHVLTESDATSGEMPGHQRRPVPRSPATPAQSARIPARPASTREALSQAGVMGLQRKSRTMP